MVRSRLGFGDQVGVGNRVVRCPRHRRHLLLSIDFPTLYRLLEQRPRLARRWMVSISARIVGVQERLVDLLARSMEA